MSNITNEERGLYYERIYKHGETLRKMMDDPKTKSMVQFILKPKDSTDLLMINSYFDYLEDLNNLQEDLLADNIKIGNLKDNLFVELLKYSKKSENQSAKKTKRDFKKNILSRYDGETDFLAHLVFDMSIIYSALDCVDTLDEIFSEEDYDLGVETSIRLAFLFGTLDIDNPKFHTRDAKENQRYLDYKERFHKVYEESIINKKDNESKKHNK